LAYAYRIDGFELHEAIATLDYCRRNYRVQWLYLHEDMKRSPNSNHEYSHWKLREARADLRAAIKRIRAFYVPHLKLAGEN
jgi:hypothetical protein